jgi:hypothetical protein
MNKKLLYILIGLVVLTALGAGIWYLLRPGKEEGAPKGDSYNWSTMEQGPYRDKISFATSADLLNWEDSNQILAQHASVPDAIDKDGVIYIYFVDVSQDGKPEQIGLIKSADQGRTWSEKVNITIQGQGDKVAVDPAPFLLSDGRIRLYFFDIADTRVPGRSGKIYSALSDDGVSFVLEQGIRLERQAGLFDPDVTWVDGNWFMYVGDGAGQNTIVATSSDGMTFVEKGVAYTGGAIPNVFYNGEKFFLYTGGIDIATSSDGLTFTKTNFRFDSSYGLTADPGVIQLGTNNYLMVFKTKEEQTPKP